MAAFFHSLLRIPDDNLIVISRGDDFSSMLGKSPDFTVVVRAHDSSAVTTTAGTMPDSSVAKTNKEGIVHAINSSDKIVEFPLFRRAFVGNVDLVDISIFAAREEFSIDPFNCADETFLVGTNCTSTLSLSTDPAVDLRVGTSTVGVTLVIPGDT